MNKSSGLENLIEKNLNLLKENNIFKKINFKSTFIYGSVGSLMGGFGLPLVTSFNHPNLISGILTGGIFGLSFKYFSIFPSKKTFNDEKKKNSEIALLMNQNNYLTNLIEKFKSDYDYQGDYEIEEDLSFQGGTNLAKGGYLAKLNVKFDDGNILNLFCKHEVDSEILPSDRITEYFSKYSGFDFIKGNSLPLSLPDKVPGKISEELDGESLEFFLRTENDFICKNKEEIDSHLFLKMFRIYNSSYISYVDLKEHKFHDKLISKLNEGNGEFIKKYDEIYKLNFDSKLKKSIIHGDLHQGNIIVKNLKEQYIIDWDNLEIGIPYQDFVHYTVLSDLINSVHYNKIKDNFLHFQDNIIGNIDKSKLSLIEFDTYLSLLNRYYSLLDENIVQKNELLEGKVLLGCKYLDKLARSSLTEYSIQDANLTLKGLYNAYSNEEFVRLKNVELDSFYNISELHYLNVDVKTADKSLLKRNISKHNKSFLKSGWVSNNPDYFLNLTNFVGSSYLGFGQYASFVGYSKGNIGINEYLFFLMSDLFVGGALIGVNLLKKRRDRKNEKLNI